MQQPRIVGVGNEESSGGWLKLVRINKRLLAHGVQRQLLRPATGHHIYISPVPKMH